MLDAKSAAAEDVGLRQFQVRDLYEFEVSSLCNHIRQSNEVVVRFVASTAMSDQQDSSVPSLSWHGIVSVGSCRISDALR